MVAPRKDIPSFIPQNLLLLRSRKGYTLENMAEIVGVRGKTSYHAYEIGKALPDVFKLMKIAVHFDVSLEDLVYRDLSKNEKASENLNSKLYQVDFVPITAKAGYPSGFGDPEYLAELPTISVPFKPYGIARAFEIEGDSMEPDIEDEAIVVGIKVSSSEIRDRKVYIVVSSEGVQCKQIRTSENLVYLISTNQKYLPQHLNKSDVKEIWEVWKKIKPGET